MIIYKIANNEWRDINCGYHVTHKNVMIHDYLYEMYDIDGIIEFSGYGVNGQGSTINMIQQGFQL